MSEYDLLCRILDREFLSPSQEWMIESKGTTHKPQKVQIDKTGKKIFHIHCIDSIWMTKSFCRSLINRMTHRKG